MPDETDDLIRYRLDRAQTAWHDASLLLSKGSRESAVNRLYYAAFYGVSALLLTKDLASAKHKGVRSLFNRHFIATGQVSKEAAIVYNDLFERRQSADYADFIQFRAEDVSKWVDDCRTLLDEIRSYIEAIKDA